MPEYVSPGYFYEEVFGGARPIAGVNTDIAGFVGMAERGPLPPQLITSWSQFRRLYGDPDPTASYLAYAVEGFFANGGRRCYVTRIVRPDATTSALLHAGILNVVAISPGQWGNKIGLDIEPASQADQPGWFRLSLYWSGILVERFDDLSLDPDTANYLMTRVNKDSNLVRVWLTDDIPPETGIPLSTTTAKLTGGEDGVLSWDRDAFIGHQDVLLIPQPGNTAPPEALLGAGTGLAALETEQDIAIVVVPDQAREEWYTDLANVIVEYCERMQDCIGLLSVPLNQTDVRHIFPPVDSPNAALYYPWIKVYDTSANNSLFVPAVGHVAGIMARTDRERGVYKAPANEILRGVLSLEFAVTEAMQNELNPRGINCIRDFSTTGRGIRLWGARTVSSDPDWKYVNIRRFYLYITKSIDLGLQWTVFLPNIETTWSEVRRHVSDFLLNTWREGGLKGQTPDEAYFVRCDRTTMTQNDIDNGQLVVLVGLAMLRPAEFVILRINKIVGEITS